MLQLTYKNDNKRGLMKFTNELWEVTKPTITDISFKHVNIFGMFTDDELRTMNDIFIEKFNMDIFSLTTDLSISMDYNIYGMQGVYYPTFHAIVIQKIKGAKSLAPLFVHELTHYVQDILGMWDFINGVKPEKSPIQEFLNTLDLKAYMGVPYEAHAYGVQAEFIKRCYNMTFDEWNIYVAKEMMGL